MTDQAQLADRIAWGRARAATVMAIVFVAAQAGSFPDDLPLNRPQTIHLAAWIVWAAALLLFLPLAQASTWRRTELSPLMKRLWPAAAIATAYPGAAPSRDSRPS